MSQTISTLELTEGQIITSPDFVRGRLIAGEPHVCIGVIGEHADLEVDDTRGTARFCVESVTPLPGVGVNVVARRLNDDLQFSCALESIEFIGTNDDTNIPVGRVAIAAVAMHGIMRDSAWSC